MPAQPVMIERERSIERATFRLRFHCDVCAATLERVVRSIDGVALAAVLPVSDEAVVDYDPTLMAATDLCEAMAGAGFEVKLLETRRWVVR